MKFLLLMFVSMISLLPVHAQLKTTVTCPPLEVDVLAGNVNKMTPKATFGEIKKAFPCFTAATEVEEPGACQGVFLKDKGLNFFTGRNYIEVDAHFKGKLTPAIMGTNRSELFKTLGYPKIKDVSWDAFNTEYGLLILYYDKAGKVNKIQISNKGVDTIKLCE